MTETANHLEGEWSLSAFASLCIEVGRENYEGAVCVQVNQQGIISHNKCTLIQRVWSSSYVPAVLLDSVREQNKVLPSWTFSSCKGGQTDQYCFQW